MEMQSHSEHVPRASHNMRSDLHLKIMSMVVAVGLHCIPVCFLSHLVVGHRFTLILNMRFYLF